MAISGREVFQNYRTLISFAERTYNILPRPIQKTIYTVIKNKKIRVLFRYYDLRSKGFDIKENIYIAENVILKNSDKLTLGINFSVHEFSYIDAIGGISIGDNVSIAHNSSLISFEHTWIDKNVPIKYNPVITNSINIGNDVWIGCGVRILSGTVIQDRVIVAAGAVVKGVLESGYLYGGVPARRIKKL